MDVSKKTKRSRIEQIEALSKASTSITRAMTAVPENVLCAAILRSFQMWPYHTLSVPMDLSIHLQEIADRAREIIGAEISAIGVGRFPDQSSTYDLNIRSRSYEKCNSASIQTVISKDSN